MDSQKKSNTQLSTGVELGCWAYPANPNSSLPPLTLTQEELIQVVSDNSDPTELLTKLTSKKERSISFPGNNFNSWD